MPIGDERVKRFAAVRHVLYLIFNEGYAGSSGIQQRTDLANEAIRLTRALVKMIGTDPETIGLLALMLLTEARRSARIGQSGELIPLAEQDRTLWDRRAIKEGIDLVSQALTQGSIGPYQLQAAIAALHDEAESVEETDWPQILALYGLLRQMTDNPMIILNQAVAASMVHGPEVALKMLEPLDADKRFAGHYRLASVRAHLLERQQDVKGAIHHYRLAAEGTRNILERNYLLEQIIRLSGLINP